MTTTAETDRLRGLVEAGIALSSELSLDDLLQKLAEIAAALTGARYAALGVIDQSGTGLERFLHTGIDAEAAAKIGDLPRGRGILGALITDAQPLRLDAITDDPRSVGFPPHHPPMRGFLGVPILLRGRAFGNLYLTEKQQGSFTAADQELVETLASQAAVAIENARLYEAATCMVGPARGDERGRDRARQRDRAAAASGADCPPSARADQRAPRHDRPAGRRRDAPDRGRRRRGCGRDRRSAAGEKGLEERPRARTASRRARGLHARRPRSRPGVRPAPRSSQRALRTARGRRQCDRGAGRSRPRRQRPAFHRGRPAAHGDVRAPRRRRGRPLRARCRGRTAPGRRGAGARAPQARARAARPDRPGADLGAARAEGGRGGEDRRGADSSPRRRTRTGRRDAPRRPPACGRAAAEGARRLRPRRGTRAPARNVRGADRDARGARGADRRPARRPTSRQRSTGSCRRR